MLEDRMYTDMSPKKTPLENLALSTHLVTKEKKKNTCEAAVSRNAPIGLYLCEHVCECPSLLEWLSMQLKQEEQGNCTEKHILPTHVAVTIGCPCVPIYSTARKNLE